MSTNGTKERAPAELLGITTTAPQNTAPLIPLRSLLDELALDAKRRREAKTTGARLGPVTGFPAFDEAIDGALFPGLHILHGAPGIGKTAFVLQIAASCECPCVYVTSEMIPLELLRRIIARVTNTYLGRLKSGEMSVDQVMNLARQAIDTAPYLTILDATRGSAPTDRIREAAMDTLKQAQDNSPHILIVIDSIHSWTRAVQGGAMEYDALSGALDTLKRLSAELEAPILCVSERNRSAMSAGGQNAVKGTAQFEYIAETIIGLDTEADKTERGKPFVVKATLEKNRGGIQGKILAFEFNGAIQKFTPQD